MKNFFFHKLFGNGHLLTNDFGNSVLLSDEEYRLFISDEVEMISKDTQEKLQKGYFLLPTPLSADCIEILQETTRKTKWYLFQGPVLHIFNITNGCNYQCVYCQASATSRHPMIMPTETAKKAVHIALQSPSGRLTFEFQGGEPLLGFRTIKEIVQETKRENQDKTITFNIVSNLSLLNNDMVGFFQENHFSIATSLDGDALLQRRNRQCKTSDSWADAREGIKKLRDAGIPVTAIQTTTKYSLTQAKEIINCYSSLGFISIFIRPLTRLGKASADWAGIGYTAEEFLLFYRQCFFLILEKNKEGFPIKETYASILLGKIFHTSVANYMELRSPCGAGIGQITYNYDGTVSTCDEGRMLAEMGNPLFQMGTVDNTLNELMRSATCRSVCAASILESAPECFDCVYQPYCGNCPIMNYVTSQELFPSKPNSFRCKITKGILDLLFNCIYYGSADYISILHAWSEE